LLARRAKRVHRGVYTAQAQCAYQFAGKPQDEGGTMSLLRNRTIEKAEHVQDGKGYMLKDVLLTDDHLNGKLTFTSSITLDPGCSIGTHTHIGDNEMYFIYEGAGLYTDNDETYPVQAGDVVFCEEGETHSIENDSDAPLKFIAVIQACE
jgi:quercetin dioxygenase-like cupin family protein